MDTAVGLVQAYLRVNGYFTLAEHPVLDATGAGAPRTVTDLDILAIRLHRAPGDQPDPALGARPGAPDMIVGEVKEGAARLNRAMRDPAVLEAAFARNWAAVGRTRIKDDALGLLALIEKSHRAGIAAR